MAVSADKLRERFHSQEQEKHQDFRRIIERMEAYVDNAISAPGREITAEIDSEDARNGRLSTSFQVTGSLQEEWSGLNENAQTWIEQELQRRYFDQGYRGFRITRGLRIAQRQNVTVVELSCDLRPRHERQIVLERLVDLLSD